MNSFIEGSLLPNETIISITKKHWGIIIKSLFFVFIGIVLLICTSNTIFFIIISFLVLLYGIFSAIKAWLTKITTEYALTNIRIICKLGILKTVSRGINLDMIESIGIIQSFLGRILNYGTLVIRAKGSTVNRYNYIENPLEYKKNIEIKVSEQKNVK